MESEEKPTVKFIRDAILAVLAGFLIDPTLKALHLDVSPYLRHVWYGIAVFLTLDALKRSRYLSSKLIAFRSSLTGRQRMIAYIVVAVIGAGCSLFYWWGLGRVFGKETGLTEKTAEVKVDAYIQPGSSDHPYPPQTILGGIIWDDNYVDVRLDIGIGAVAIQNLDFEVALDTSIAGIGQISQFPGVTLFPRGQGMPALSLEGKDDKGAAVTVPLVPTQGLAQIAPRYRVHCNVLYSNTVLHLVIASVALNSATQGRLPEQLFAPKRTPYFIKLKGTFEVSSQAFPIEFEKHFDSPERPSKLPAEEKPAPDETPSESEPTLVSLMDTSFPRFNKLWGKPVFQFEDGSSLQVTSALYFDLFTSGAKFLGFHIPSSAHVLEVCALLAEHAIELGDALANGGLSIIAESPGENPQTISDLRYSGKVYLHHEDAFTHRQMAEVEDIFKKHQLNVVLRGPDFLTPAWIAWKQRSLKRPS